MLFRSNFRAVPSFDAFSRYLLGSAPEAAPLAEAGPFGVWIGLWQQAWAPWLEIAKAMQEQAATKAPQAPAGELSGETIADAEQQEAKFATG